MNEKIKIIVILGPTATGKSDLGVRLALRLRSGQAKKFAGEIISADSRQVYKGLDIGTGKITKHEMKGISHHLLDVASPKRKFTVADYKKLAEISIQNIVQKNKVPIIVGGTGFYIQALVDDLILPEVPPNESLRKKLEKKNVSELFKILKKLDPERAKDIDAKNPRRLVRAIEIAKYLGKVPKLKKKSEKYDVLFIGIDLPDKVLKERIHKRLIQRISVGMIAEARKLHKNGLGYKRMEELGLEYRYLSRFLKKFARGSASSPHWSAYQEELEKEIWQYAKRQRTWFKKDKRIKNFNPTEIYKIEKEVNKFLKF